MFTTTPTFSSYSVNDLETALTFYRDTLGLEVTQTPEGLSLELTGNTVFLYPKIDHIPATFTVLNFQVEDIDSAVADLTANNIPLKRYDIDGMESDEMGIYRGKASGNGPDIAWFTDPAGNILSVLEA